MVELAVLTKVLNPLLSMRWRQTAGSWLLLTRLSLPAGKEDEKGSSPFRLEIDLFKEFFSMVSTDLLFIYDKILV